MLGQFYIKPPNPELQGSFHFRFHFSDRLTNREDVISQFVISGLPVEQLKENKEKIQEELRKSRPRHFWRTEVQKRCGSMHSSCHNQGCPTAAYVKAGMAAAHGDIIIPPVSQKGEQYTPPSHPILRLLCCEICIFC